MTCLISFLTVVVFCRTVDLTVRKGVAFWASVFIYSAVSEANACLSDVPGNLRCVGSFVSPVPSNKIGRTTPTNKSVLLSFFSSFLFLHYFTLDLSTSFVCVCVFFFFRPGARFSLLFLPGSSPFPLGSSLPRPSFLLRSSFFTWLAKI